MHPITSILPDFTRSRAGLVLPVILRRCFYVLVCLQFGLSFANGQVDIEQLEEDAIRKAVAEVAPSVIRFETLGGNSRVDGEVVASGPATGLAISSDGFVISASFHFAHGPASILARLPDGTKATAQIVGRDLSRKIVLLKINSDFQFVIPPIANSSRVQVGQTVVAVGRAFDVETTNISTGIVSAKNRIWNKAIQTDAKISPANFGGPLLDLSGKVIGILVPMSPDDDREMGGTQWYDSGIGFAVPLDRIMKRLQQLKSGKPMRAGLLGVSLVGSDIYVDKTTIAFCNGTSPAGKSGMRSGDEIVEINGTPIRRQSEMKHALGELYAGDNAEIVILRAGTRISMSVELAGEIAPYLPPALGLILGTTTDNELVIQKVVPDSPAEDAALKFGDRIKQFDDVEIESQQQLRQMVAGADVGAKFQLKILRSAKELTIPITVGIQTAAPTASPTDSSGEREFKIVNIQVADMANKCLAIIPAKPIVDDLPALLVWIPPPGKIDKVKIEERWFDDCQKHNVVLLVPESTDEKRWRPDDIDFCISAMDKLAKQSVFDREHVAIGGSKTGGTMASLIAFDQRDLFKGLVLLDSRISGRIRQMTTSPVEPLMILIGATTENDGQDQTAKQLRKENFPVHEKFDAQKPNVKQWIGEIFQWVKTVNRI